MLRKLWGSSIPLTMNQSGDGGNSGDTSSRDEDVPPEERETAQDEAIEQVAEETGGGAEAQRKEEEQIFPAIDEGDEHPLMPVRQFLGEHDQVSESEKQTMRIEIPTRTIIKVVLTLVAIWLVLKVISIFLLLLLAVLLCLALLPLVRRLENQGMGRGGATSTVFATMIAIFAGFLWLVVPQLTNQTQNLIDSAPDYVDNFSSVLDRYPTVQDRINAYLGIEDKTAIEKAADETTQGGDEKPPVDAETVTTGATKVLSYTTAILGTLANAFFVLVLAFYLLIEGERTWRYFARYMTPTLRYRFHRLGPELTNVVSGYLIGQAIISVSFGVFTYIVLLVLDVPQPLLLALASAILDAIPIVGVPVATVGAMAIGLSVSWQTSLIILGAFLLYQQVENYVLLPRVYGNTLQVTSLSILVGVLVGGQLMGILGIVLSLPLTAAIPVIERVWREVVPPEIEAMEQRGVLGPPRPEHVRTQFQRVHEQPES
jgi:predicted PurR-regulated permease PerM